MDCLRECDQVGSSKSNGSKESSTVTSLTRYPETSIDLGMIQKRASLARAIASTSMRMKLLIALLVEEMH